MFEGGEIEIVPSAPGSGDAFDVQTPAGRRRFRLMTEYLLVRYVRLVAIHFSWLNHLLVRCASM